MGRYENDPEWKDVIPIPQDDGEGALAKIAYTDEYAEAMSYLRAVMSAQEHSTRALALTKHIISLNAAHYTVWLYRARIIFALKYPIADELLWVNETALNNQKNYQIWHHRQLLIDSLYPSIFSSSSEIQELITSERAFTNEMFDEDAKNYHVWSYRQYLVRKLHMFGADELADTERWIDEDVRNNSAWSHRFFLVFSDPEYSSPDALATAKDPRLPEAIIEREVQYAKTQIEKAPQNQSPWEYLRGVLRKGDCSLKAHVQWAEEYAPIRDADSLVKERAVRSSHALDFLADAWCELPVSEEERTCADQALRLLGERYDVVRKGYWEWKRKALGKVEEVKPVQEEPHMVSV